MPEGGAVPGSGRRAFGGKVLFDPACEPVVARLGEGVGVLEVEEADHRLEEHDGEAERARLQAMEARDLLVEGGDHELSR